jgi:hypothetical protein
MRFQNTFRVAVLACMILGECSTALAQQKPQWMASGEYNVWAVENAFVYVTDTKFLGETWDFN